MQINADFKSIPVCSGAIHCASLLDFARSIQLTIIDSAQASVSCLGSDI